MGFVSTLFALIAGAVTIKNCGTTGDLAKYVSGSFTPIPPIPGENATLSFIYDLSTEITGGTATYSTTINFIPFPPSTEDLCTQTACPILAGTNTETSTSAFPTGVSGTIVTKIQWADQDANPILCVQTTFNI